MEQLPQMLSIYHNNDYKHDIYRKTAADGLPCLGYRKFLKN